MMKLNPFHGTSTAFTLLAAGVLAASSAAALAGDLGAAPGDAGPAGPATPDDKLAKSVIEPEAPESRIHGLFQVEFGNHYVTPRGLDVVDSGLTIQPLFVLLIDLYSRKTGFLNDITLAGSIWNDWGTVAYGAKPGQWNEIDPGVALSFKFLKALQFDVGFTGFRSETDSYLTSTNLDYKLTYHDSAFGAFSINPYVELFEEVSNKATVSFDYATNREGFYFQLGVDPTYNCKPFPLTIELPTYVSLVSTYFYQKADGTPGGSGVGVVSTGIKFSIPLNFIPKGYGSWTFYAGYQYYYDHNQGLLQGNLLLTGKTYEERDLHRFYGGLTLFF